MLFVLMHFFVSCLIKVEDSGPLEVKEASVDEGVVVVLLEEEEEDEEGSEGAKG